MALALARARPGDGDSEAALRRALAATVRGRLDAAERAWVERIEERRRRLVVDRTPTGLPVFTEDEEAGGEYAVGEPELETGLASALMSLSPHWCLLLLRVVRELAPRSALELGTGFGISGAYQAAALELNGSGRMTTIEGSDAWAAIARDGFSELGLGRVTSVVGPIGERALTEAASAAPLDFVFIDAEHQERATVEHFEAVLPSLADGALVLFDDADWEPVRRAHERIAADGRVRSSFAIGRFAATIVGTRSPAG